MLKKLDRLTERDKKGIAWPVWKDKSIPCYQKKLIDELWCIEGRCTDADCDFRNILNKLADYEDTKMTPEEIKEMKDNYKECRKNYDRQK